MLSLAPPIPKPTLPKPSRFQHHARQSKPIAVAASFNRLPSPPPPPPPGADLYQPFRPPPSPLPKKYRSMDPADRIDVLRNRLGIWHDYAPLISSLSHDGFTPSSIEELTGITGVEQNRLVVAVRVRDSLLQTLPPELIPSFDPASSAEVLYELRLLNNTQRAAAARYLLARSLDGRCAQDLARAVRDFPRRRGDEGWERFSADSPADCLAYTYFRLSREAIDAPDKLSWLDKAMETAETEEARGRIEQEMDKVARKGDGAGVDEDAPARAAMPVVRLRYGEVAEASTVVLLPACRAAEGKEKVKGAPEACKWEGELGVVAADREWGRWVLLPGWPPVLGMGGVGGVAVEFADARMMPWRLNRWEKEEAVVAVVDRKRKEIVKKEDEDGFYLVSGGGDRLEVERGSKIVADGGGKEVLGAVVLVVRPPKEDDDQLSEEDWD